jgi:hypothetical protein
MARDDAAGDGLTPRFRAFVSYSHLDKVLARRLQRRLEAYRVPRRLAGRVAPLGTAAGRVGPVFRDREDFAAGADLTEAVKEALARSQALIVLCSPAAARSPWVAREIALFRAAHPGRPVLAALIEGTPEQAFPAAIRANGAEPLAADFRRGGDGGRLAFLKIVAGILSIPLDELIQRDGQRRQRRVTAVTAASVLAMLVLAAMTILALRASADAQRQRSEAERQRGEAEGLVEYMLTDLRQGLKGVGRLDLMDKVNRRAMAYYADQGPPAKLRDSSLERRARIIGAMGEDDENRGDLDGALARYTALYRTTEALLAKDPGDPERVLAHAESVNRLALLAGTRGKSARALRAFVRTRELLASIEPWGRGRDRWLRLFALANGNICATILKGGRDRAGALGDCRRAVLYNEALRRRPDDDSVAYDLVFHRLWLAEAEQAAGEADAARRTRASYLALTDSLVERDPRNMLWREQQMEVYVRHARLLRALGDRAGAAAFLKKARAISRRLAARDPNNDVWSDYRTRLSAPPKRRLNHGR